MFHSVSSRLFEKIVEKLEKMISFREKNIELIKKTAYELLDCDTDIDSTADL